MSINRDVRVDFIGRDRTSAAARSAANGVKRVNREVSVLSTRAVAAQRAFSALTIGFAGTNAVRTLGQLQESMLRVKNLSQDYAKDQEFLSKTTKALNLDLGNAAKAFADIQVLQNTGFINDNQVQDLFIGFQETAKKFGVGATDIEFALRGLRQALTAGVVRAQEFDQIFDAIGAVAPSVARNLGLTTQELLQLRTSSSLSSKALLDALIPALREADGSAALASKNINASLQNLSTAYKEALLQFSEPIGDGISAFADAGIGAIDLLVENTGKIKLVGTAIAAAYGGRALASIATMSAAQARGIQISIARAEATARNNALLVTEAKQKQEILRLEQASLISQRQSLQQSLAEASTIEAKRIVQKQLTAATERETAGRIALSEANARTTASTVALTAAQRSATASSLAFSTATRALGGAMSLVGGPIGLAAIAIGAFVLNARDGTRAIRELREANEELESRASVIGQRAFDEIARTREEAEIKLNELYKKRTKLIDEQVVKNSRLSADQGRMGSYLFKINSQIKETISLLEEIDLKKEAFQQAEAARQDIEALNLAAKDLIGTFDRSGELIDKFLPDRGKIEELKKALEQARKSFEPDSEDGKKVISAIQAEIDALDGSAKARKEYKKQITEARKELDTLNESLQTERQRVEETFASSEATILLNVELGSIDDTKASTLIARAREKMSAELAALDKADTDSAQRAFEEKQRLRDKEVADMRQYTDRLIQARTAINPEQGEAERFRLALLRLNAERGKSIQSDQDYHDFVEAEKKRHFETLEQLEQERLDSQRKLFENLSSAEKTQVLGSIGNDFLNAFQKNVGSYIQLNDDMTKAEKNHAIASNKINKKRFEQNKKASIAQAIISTITGATRAFETVPYPFNFAAAAAISAAGFRNVANIRGSSFGGASGGSVSSGAGISGGSSNSQSTSGSTPSQPSPQINVTFNVDSTLFNQDAFNRMSANAMAEATQKRELVYDSDKQFYRNNSEAA